MDTKAIIAGCIASDRKCQELLYRQYYTIMVRVCCRYVDIAEAATLYNESMQKVLAGIHQFKEQGELGAWIRRIVINTCIDHCRTITKFIMHPVTVNEESDLTVDPDVYQKYSAAAAMNMLQSLPKNTALVFNLFAIEGYKHEEIAEMLQIAIGTSKWHLNEARRLLKNQLSTGNKIYSNVI